MAFKVSRSVSEKLLEIAQEAEPIFADRKWIYYCSENKKRIVPDCNRILQMLECLVEYLKDSKAGSVSSGRFTISRNGHLFLEGLNFTKQWDLDLDETTF